MLWSQNQTPRAVIRFREPLTFRRARFTLIEMMVVLVIASILIGMAVYGYQSIGKNVVASSGRMVNGQLRLCRSYAVAKREYVALLLPDSADLSVNLGSMDVLREQYSDQAMRPCIVTISGGTVTFKEYIKGGDWRLASKGVSIVPSTTEVCQDVKFPEADSTPTISMKCLIFKPTGQLNVANTVTLDVHRKDLGAAQEDNKIRLSVNWLTGKVSYLD